MYDQTPPPPMPPPFPPQSPPGKGMAVASLVLGIVAVVFFWLSYLIFPFLVAIVGLVLGVIGKKQLADAGQPSGMAVAGMVMSIVALGLNLLCVICVCGTWGYVVNNPSHDFWDSFDF